MCAPCNVSLWCLPQSSTEHFRLFVQSGIRCPICRQHQQALFSFKKVTRCESDFCKNTLHADTKWPLELCIQQPCWLTCGELVLLSVDVYLMLDEGRDAALMLEDTYSIALRCWIRNFNRDGNGSLLSTMLLTLLTSSAHLRFTKLLYEADCG